MANKTKQKSRKIKVRVARTPSSRQKSASKELTILGSALRSLGGLGGGALGGLIGMPTAGSSLGSSLGASISKWLGSGDYTVGANSVVKRSMHSPVPAMHQTNQSITVRHREYVTAIQGSTNFAIQGSYILNPGLSDTFPWLSGIAQSYQEYAIKGMVFHYVPTSGTAVSGTNPALGSVMIQTSYRSNDAPPSSKVELLNEFFSNEVVPCHEMAHPIECDPKENPFAIHYIRNTSIPTNDSPLMYDVGVTTIATAGMPATGNVVGDLWVTYEVELKKPIVSSNVTADAWAGMSFSSPGSASNLFGTLGPNGYVVPSSNAGNIFVTVNNTNMITIPKGTSGNFLLCVYITSLTSSITSTNWPTVPTTTNLSAFTGGLFGDGLQYFGQNQSTTSNAGFMFAFTKPDQSVAATIQIPTPTLSGTWDKTRLCLIKIY